MSLDRGTVPLSLLLMEMKLLFFIAKKSTRGQVCLSPFVFFRNMLYFYWAVNNAKTSTEEK